MSDSKIDFSISVAVVLYNSSISAVNNQVRNILESTKNFKKVTLYLINNSVDNVGLSSGLRDLERNPRIKVLIPSANQGFGKGNNMVLPYLQSDYHFVVNPDVVIPNENQLKRMLDFLHVHTEYGLLTPLIKYPSGEEQHLMKREANVLDMGLRFLNLSLFKKRQERFVCLPDGYKSIHDAENVPGSFMLFRTEVFRKIKGFDEKYFLYMEDSDITMKTRQVSRVVFFPESYVYHEWQRNNRKSLSGIFQMLTSMFVYFNKWGWRLW
ncbi:Glycosyl transferase group 2 family protein [Lactiplantibacillus plantarum]|uniref:glycosyltransferase n=1 Tax=Lactiplantibacillus plantarum TaxID=1590 RepID=UPI0007ABBD66|nr:glycosyltransferase [Lactiplantibacillus plantarum]KZD97330.1 Glycosyl transferase group 2 family protein [Lactiplantibacillus plantarum]